MGGLGGRGVKRNKDRKNETNKDKKSPDEGGREKTRMKRAVHTCRWPLLRLPRDSVLETTVLLLRLASFSNAATLV